MHLAPLNCIWGLTFVTESLTFMAGTFSFPAVIILARLWTPVVVSSDRPLISVIFDKINMGVIKEV